jgi:predicted DNA-binding transcriptional regulator YafY
MSKNNKIKFLKILEILRNTDEFHPMNASQIVTKLGTLGIEAERKSVLRDIHVLEEAGYTIVSCQNHNDGFYMIDQQFDDYELKILSDAVNTLDILTVKDVTDLTKKISSLATDEGKRIIKSNTYIDFSSKSEDYMNKIKIDVIIRAIKNKRKISFQYYEYSAEGKNYLLRNGYTYVVSPYHLILKEREYFLIGNVNTNDGLTFFRIEMISNIQEVDEASRKKSSIKEYESYTDGTIQMSQFLRQKINFCSGEKVEIKLKCSNQIIKHVEKQFGKGIWMKPLEDKTFYTRVELEESEALYQWIASFGRRIEIISPEKTRSSFRKYLEDTLLRYNK